MDQDTSPSGVSSNEHGGAASAQHQKRTRVLLSCAPCRNSKLKCDRDNPCGQCLKKGRADLCVYAPKPQRHKPVRGMAARLRRLEGMVRGMMDADGNLIPEDSAVAKNLQPPGEVPQVMGQVVRGENATTYVGATHCLAMLEDIEDLKSYFDDPEDAGEAASPEEDMDGLEMLLYERGAPRNREELTSMLPDRTVVDRVITRYFSSMSPSQHIVHRPSFGRMYARFWADPTSVPLHWIAQLFMMLALGTFFNNIAAPHELQADSPEPAQDRIKHYRSCAGWALIWGKYTQPTFATLPAFLLYVEAHFQFNRATQMNCYILSGVLVRLMLKMGLHRDPSKLANITPFEGEMRRRVWNMAIQVDLLVAFHMGLPSMLQGIETDTQVPRNLQDDDFDEDSTELPPSRPDTDYTSMTYANNKTKLLRVFSQLARQAHALSPPTYAEVMKLDTLLQDVWDRVPPFMKPKPLGECIGEAPSLITQRFGLASLYEKSLCVLHRRYLGEAVPKNEHEYSRKRGLQAAMTLMDYQYTIWDASQPGHVLGQNGWFVSSLAVHDFTLAAMVIYLVIQTDSSSGDEFEALSRPHPTTPTKSELQDLLKRSHFIWTELANATPEFRKTADTLAIMLAKTGAPVGEDSTSAPTTGMTVRTNGSSNESSLGSSVAPKSSVGTYRSEEDPLATLGLGDTSAKDIRGPRDPDMPIWLSAGSSMGQTTFSTGQAVDATTGVDYSGIGAMASADQSGLDFDPSWISSGDNMDWRYLDVSMASHFDAGNDPSLAHSFLERLPLNDVDAMDGGGGATWNMPSGGNVSDRR